jgi:hypothetical protein
MNNTDKLIEISSNERSSNLDTTLLESTQSINPSLVKELTHLLSKRNGFLAFESALNVFSADPKDIVKNIFDWNTRLEEHSAFEKGKLFLFAEDIFMEQFGITSDGIVRFNLESGDINFHSNSIDEWAGKLLSDYDYEAGWSIAKEWQKINGRLGNGYRLFPKMPFTLGGEYVYSNMLALKGNEALHTLARFYNQIKNLNDGESVKIDGWFE